MSGRRSSKLDGSPAGISRQDRKSRPRRDAQLRRRLADQRGNRVFELAALDRNRDRAGSRAFDCRARLRHVGGRDETGIVLVLGDPQKLGVGFHGRIEQPAQLVEYADGHIGRRQLRLRREARRGKIGGAGLRGRYCTGHIQPNTAPQIGDPAGRPGGAERVTYLARSIRDAGPGAARNSGARARRRRIHVHCWKKTGARRGNRFRRVAKRRFGRRHVLV